MRHGVRDITHKYLLFMLYNRSKSVFEIFPSIVASSSYTYLVQSVTAMVSYLAFWYKSNLIDLAANTPNLFYKKRSKRVTSRDFVFLYNFCTVVSYFYRSSVDSRFLLLTNKLDNFRDFFYVWDKFCQFKISKMSK